MEAKKQLALKLGAGRLGQSTRGIYLPSTTLPLLRQSPPISRLGSPCASITPPPGAQSGSRERNFMALHPFLPKKNYKIFLQFFVSAWNKGF